MFPTHDETTVPFEDDSEHQHHPEHPALTILYHPDVSRVGDRFVFPTAKNVLLSRVEPPFISQNDQEKYLKDSALSRTPFEFKREKNDLILYRGESKMTARINGEPLKDRWVFSADHLKQGAFISLSGRILLYLHKYQTRMTRVPTYGLIGDSNALQVIREDMSRVADLDVPILIRGETGTGKELVARGIHMASNYRKGPFVAVNMGALPSTMVVSELFGSARGAFSGADRDRPGYFQRANGGTLFLDEIGEANLDAQTALLRVLETGEVFPVGSRTPQKPQVRILAATDANLEQRSDDDLFRSPLLHRLAGYSILLPRLKDRRDDIARLFIYFLEKELYEIHETHKLQKTKEPWLPITLIEKVVSSNWSGNVRQLRNFARQVVLVNRGREQFNMDARLDFAELSTTQKTQEKPRRRKPSDINYEELATCLQKNNYELSGTSRDLKVSRSSLYDLMRKHKFRLAADVTPHEIVQAFHQTNGDLKAMVEMLKVSRSAIKSKLKEQSLL